MIKKIFVCLFAILLCGPEAMAQAKTLKGTVMDTDGVPLPGVNVYVPGKENRGTTTTMDGNYVITEVLATDSLVFSYMGFTTQTVLIGNRTTLDMVMEEDSYSLDEYTVVAFQRQKKESVIGSIQTINPKELKVPQSNLTTALAGRMAGIISYQRSGEPGKDNAEFFIRGVTTFGYKASPLILIDGLEVSTEDLARLEPDNIETFSIMKDATATALYGARGANGVILVNTKTGKKGKLSISARFETSISQPTKVQKFLGGVEYMEMYNTATRMRNPTAPLFYSKEKIEGTRKGLDSQIYPNVDWYGELFNDQVTNYKANMTATGGGDIAQYYLSIAFTNEKGLMKVDKMNNFNNNIDIKRYNIRANVDFDLTKTTKGAIKIYTLIDRYNGPPIYEQGRSTTEIIFGQIMNANPVNFPKYYDKNETTKYYKHTLFGNKGNGTYPNPYANMVRGYTDRSSFTSNAIFQLEQDLSVITEGLKARGFASFSSNGYTQNSRLFNPYYYGMREIETEMGTQYELYNITEGSESLNDPDLSNGTSSVFHFEVVGQYDRTFNDKHNVGGLLVFQAREALNTISGGALATLPSRNLTLSGRFTYGYDSRYFVEGNFGYNGSEKFSKANRWGFFPSAGLGWMVSNEHFYPGSWKKWVSTLKLKATYGLAGNDAISRADDRFFYLSDVNTSSSTYGYTWGFDANNGYNGYAIDRYANPSVSWETAKIGNYGIELGLKDGLINIQAEYFNQHRTNIYMARETVPASMGLTSAIKSNLGEAKSYGFDGSIDLNWSINKDWWLSGRFNYTYATSEMTVNSEPEYKYSYRSRIGQSLDQGWGYVAERLFIDDEDVKNSPNQFGLSNYMPGDIKYVDINKDGKIDEDDQVPIGYPTSPEIIYGFGLSAGYKDFDFSFFFQGAGNTSLFIDQANIAPFIKERNALQIIMDDYWSEDNPNPYAFWPRLSTENVANNQYQSTWWARDASFLRLKSVEFGYTLPSKLVKSWKMNSIRFYFQGNNLLCFSKFKLWDPEMGGKGLNYPTQRVFNVGLNVTF